MEIITTHKNTDLDALASLFAAKFFYPQAKLILPSRVNPNVRFFLSLHKDIFSYYSHNDIDLKKISKLIVVDTNCWNRLEGMNSLRKQNGLVIHLWDHHPIKGDIKSNWSCQEVIGANTTLFISRFEKISKKITPIQATLFLAGIYEDTGNLSFPNSTAKDARAVAYLMDMQADLKVIRELLRGVYGPKQKDVLFKMLKNSHRMKIGSYCISINSTEINGHTPGLAIIASMLQDILNVDAVFCIFLEKDKNQIILIGRSAVDSLNIGTIMRTMGGGGHPGAGSVLLKAVNPASVKEWIIELINGNQQSTIKISDLMSFPVAGIPPDTSMEDVDIIFKEQNYTGLPVMEDEKIVGIISRRDFNRVRDSSHFQSPVKAFMSNNVITIDPKSSCTKAARLMIKHDIGRLPVVEDGRIIGIITRSDAMRYFYDILPE